jgi:hypothetical protein
MNGKHVVIGLFALVAIVGIITFALYLLTRQDEAQEGDFVPNAVTVEYVTPSLAYGLV